MNAKRNDDTDDKINSGDKLQSTNRESAASVYGV